MAREEERDTVGCWGRITAAGNTTGRACYTSYSGPKPSQWVTAPAKSQDSGIAPKAKSTCRKGRGGGGEGEGEGRGGGDSFTQSQTHLHSFLHNSSLVLCGNYSLGIQSV